VYIGPQRSPNAVIKYSFNIVFILFHRFDINTTSGDDTKEIIIQLSQRDSRSLLMDTQENLVIGFSILKVESNRKYRLHQFSSADAIAAKSDYIKTKHIFVRTSSLGPGRYIIIVTTFEPGQTTDYLLRIFTQQDTDLTLLTKDVPIPKWYQCFTKQPVLMTRITVKSASGLEKQDVFGSKL
jgi:calpain-5